MATEPFPRCFDSQKQWSIWRELALVSLPGGNGYCVDCLPSFQSQMIRERRCAFPGVTFVMVDDRLEGRRSLKSKKEMMYQTEEVR